MWVSPSDHKLIGTYLADVRRAAGVSQVELAARLGKPQSFVSSYERGQRRVDFLEFVLIAMALGANAEQIGRGLLERVVALVKGDEN